MPSSSGKGVIIQPSAGVGMHRYGINMDMTSAQTWHQHGHGISQAANGKCSWRLSANPGTVGISLENLSTKVTENYYESQV